MMKSKVFSWCNFFEDLSFLNTRSNLKSSSEVWIASKELFDSPCHNNLEFYNFLVQVLFTTSKTKLDILYITNLAFELPHNFPNVLRSQKIRKY